jgi:hypothetical protein
MANKKPTSVFSLMSQRFMRFSMLATLTPSGVLPAIWGSWVLLLPTIPLIMAANVFKFRARLPFGLVG